MTPRTGLWPSHKNEFPFHILSAYLGGSGRVCVCVCTGAQVHMPECTHMDQRMRPVWHLSDTIHYLLFLILSKGLSVA